ncbi:MAG: NAD(P)/FAD-dependent oxidoreductase [Pleurocapsa sp.]
MNQKIVIIGCGIIGAAIAYELSLIKGLKITVIEQSQKPASASTGAALGVLMGIISHKKQGRGWRLRETSIQRYGSLISELVAQTGIDIPVNHLGIVKILFAADNVEKWHKLQKVRASQGWRLEMWDLEHLHQQCPQINLDNNQIIGAVYSPQDQQINPTKLTEALVMAATQNGAEFHFGVKCHDFERQNIEDNLARCDRLKTTAGEMDSDYVIISAGLGSTPLTAALQQAIDIRPVLGQALKFKLDNYLGKPDFQPALTGDDIHIVPLNNREYWLGATVEFPSDTGEVIADANLLATVKNKAIAFCPALADATILEIWSGKRPRPEGITAPIIGHLPQYNNVILATAHYRNGVLLAPATALEIKSLIMNKFS